MHRGTAGKEAVPRAMGRSVRLLAQEGGDVVLVDAALLQGLDGRRTVAADYRGHRVELAVVHRAGQVVSAGFLRADVASYELRLRLPRRRRRAQARGDHG